jgi:hypothetical protein
MEKQEVINRLKSLALQFKDKKYLTLKEVRTVPKLDFYIQLHFRRLKRALDASNLPSSTLATSFNIKNDDLLRYLSDLKSKMGHNPKVWDIIDDKEVYKKYFEKKVSWSILKSRFGGLKKALEQMEVHQGNSNNKVGVNKTVKENNEYFQNKNRFFGEAAELHVAAELLYRGFQAANIPVDEGLDILAVKNNKTFYFQVKHKDLSNNEQIRITKSSYARTGGGLVYYIFVLLLNDVRRFLIIPYHIFNDWILEGLVEEKETEYLLSVRKDRDDFKLKHIVLNRYLDRWEDIR